MYSEYDEGNHVVYVRKCPRSSDFIDEREKCQKCEGFFEEKDQCACQAHCNAANNVVGVSAVIGVSCLVVSRLI